MKLIKPYIKYEDIEREFREIFQSGIFTRGKFVDQFRQDICSFTGSKYGHLTTSATTALWLSLKLLGVKEDDEVIVSDFSFPATANVVEDLGATPIFADVSLDTYNMLASELESKINSKTKAVIFVDALGNPSGVTDIQAICRSHGIPLIEDAACAIGSSERGIRCGDISDITCFSFHPRKLICTGEGGAITTNNQDIHKALESKLSHGAKGYDGPGLDFVTFGYNFRMSELQAAMGSNQLRRIEEIVVSRQTIKKQYVASLESIGFKVQTVPEDTLHNVQSLVFTVPEGCDRNLLIQLLKEKGIESTLGTYSMSSIRYYREKYQAVQRNSRFLFDNTITFPCFEAVDVAMVTDAIQKSL